MIIIGELLTSGCAETMLESVSKSARSSARLLRGVLERHEEETCEAADGEERGEDSELI